MKKGYIFIVFALTFFSLDAQVITGDTAVCAGNFEIYSVPSGAGTYTWSVTGGNIQSGGNTNVATIQWGNSGVGTILVTQTGPSLLYTLSVNIYSNPTPSITHPPYPGCPTPVQQGSPIGDGRSDCEKVCKLSTVTYSTTLVAGSTYSWIANGALVLTTALNVATVTWDTTGFGYLTVIETNQYGCVDSATICVEKVNLPVALFNSQASACLNSNVLFTNQSTGAVNYQWYFGDGGSSNAVHPSHVYTSPGTYTITLIATNNCFCKDTFQRTILINSLPGPSISCPSTICAFDTASYSTTPTLGCTYNWFAIGGTIINGQGTPNVTVAWGAGQIGTLGLYISGCGGVCNDTTFLQIPIVPTSGTISGPNRVCAGDCAKFSLPRFSGAGYTWALSNSSCGGVLSDTVCCEEVEVCYPNPFLFCNDTLTVTYFDSVLGCGGSASKVIRVRPQLSIFGNKKVCSNDLSSYSAFGGGPVTCNWSISPSGPTIIPGGVAPNIAINWNGLSGTFVLTAVPNPINQVCSDSAQIVIEVEASPPAPVIVGDTIVCVNSSVQYCAVTTNTVQWVITGGTPSTAVGNCVTVNWGNTPPFIVRAFQQLNNSPFCTSDTTVQNVQPILTLPIPNIIAPLLACANTTINASTTTIYPVSAVYTWGVLPPNSGSVIVGQGTPTAQIQWGNNAPQNVTITLTVSVCNQTVNNTKVLALNPAPTVTAVQLSPLCAGGSAQLQATGGVSYNWSGPSGYSSSLNPTTITQSGLYQVTATAANTCTALSQITVQYVSGPTASISTANLTTYCIGSTYNVNICALGNPNYNYAWNNAAITQCINVNAPGSFSVVVTDVTNGCTALSNVIVVNEIVCNGSGGTVCQPNGSVSFNQTLCNPIVFTNTSVNAFNYSWNFGDLTSSSLTNPTHVYQQAGFYLVTLTALVPSVNGIDTCVVQDTAQIQVPLAAKFDHQSNCFNDPVCFTDVSTFTAGNNITSWLWNFGDANTSILQNPCHVYAAGGNYIVTLTVSNGFCTDTYIDTIFVRPQPTAAFTTSNTYCINTPILFTDASFTSINYWKWSFGDGGTSLLQNPSHTYNTPGLKNDTLIVKDIYGCYDTLAQTLFIFSPAVSGNITAIPDTIVCSGTVVTLVAPTCGTCTYLWNNASVNDSILVNNTGVYVVTITDVNGCPYSTGIQIVVNNAPPAIIQNLGDDELCVGEFTTLQVINNVNWLYQWISSDPNVNGQTTFQVSVSGLPSGTYNYQVVVTDTSTGCSDTSLPYIIVVHPLPVPPTITPLGPTTVCFGDTITLIGAHPDPTVTFKWNTGAINDTLLVLNNGCYNLEVTDTNGCKSSANQCVTVNPLPDLCTFYEGCLDTCDPYIIQGPGGAATYLWLLNGISTGVTTPTYTATVSGIYSVIVSNSFGCVDTTGNLDLTLYPCNHDSLCADLVIDSVKCVNGNHVLHYQIVNQSLDQISQVNLQILPPNLSVTYFPSLTFINIPPGGSSGPLTATITNSNNGDTLCFRAHVLAFDSLGYEVLCCFTDTQCVILPACKDTVPTSLGCYLLFPDSICQGKTATYTYGGNPTGLTFNWQFTNGLPATAIGPGPHVITYNTLGCHQVICIITDNNNNVVDCVDTICVFAPPVATIQQNGNTLFAYPAGCTYQWHQGFPAGPGILGATNQFYQPSVSDFICVVVTKGDCKDTACIDYLFSGLNELSKTSWSVYPNPNDGAFTLKITTVSFDQLELKLMNSIGETVEERIYSTRIGEQYFYIDGKAIAPGIYAVYIRTNEGVGVKKMVVR